ncbi:MAG: TldD/PmbA family protein [Myxococcales bacterium]|nr:TldD/PmbA family protein [Myxococcales bacterium]MCB9550924.1 TldD/PmbA family protein [Myxococcales bacterium]
MRLLIACLFVLALPLPAPAAKVDARASILDAMRAELDRNTARLRVDEYETPYFISYRVVERDGVTIEARFGAVVTDDRELDRVAAVDVRVGDYAFDSSPEPDDMMFMEPITWRPASEAPVADDPAALRATLWLLTDEAYKEALSTYLRKKARRVAEVRDDKSDSFSREKPVTSIGEPRSMTVDRAAWRGLAERLSTRFRKMPSLVEGAVRIAADHERVFFVNSEGTRLVRESVIYQVAFDAITRAPDGLLLDQGKTLYGRSFGELPDEAALAVMVDAAMRDLEALRQAPVADPYTGPAILEPEATGVFFHETVGHRLEGERQNDENEGQTFKGALGNRILPEFITVRDDPRREKWGEVSLNGYYLHDDQGVPAQEAVLVDGGVLRTFLTSRTPIEGVPQSNGHGRAQGTHRPMARMGNLIVEGRAPVSREKLKQMLIDEVKRQGKPYGLIIRDITGGSTNTSNYGYQAFKGTPRMVWRVDAETGAETLVRGVEMVGTPLLAVSKIIATSDEMGVFNGYCGAESGYVPVSAVAPAALFREIELQRTQQGKEKPPILPPPWAEEKP